MLRSPLQWLLLLLLPGCALGPGEPFATLEASLHTRLEVPADRALEDGWWRLSSDYEVHLTRFEVQVADGVLLGTTEDAGDDASSTGLCHGGHCHSEEGGLVPEAEVDDAGGEEDGSLHVALASPSSALDLLAGSTAPLACGDECELPLGHLHQVELHLAQVRLEGTVRDGRTQARFAGERPLVVGLTFAEGELEGLASAPLEVEIDRGGPWRVEVPLRLVPTPALLDGLDFALPAESLDPLFARQVAERLTRSLSVDATRSP